jgi:hypothetical protein
MELNEQQINFIRQDLQAAGIFMNDLLDNLVDHICCRLETYVEGSDFRSAYAKVLESFGENGLIKIQEETQRLITITKEKQMKKTMFLIGFLAVFFISNGFLFKLFHWPTTQIQLLIGFTLLNFCFLPWYFYSQYKKSTAA